jgi:hypothetical protein
MMGSQLLKLQNKGKDCAACRYACSNERCKKHCGALSLTKSSASRLVAILSVLMNVTVIALMALLQAVAVVLRKVASFDLEERGGRMMP